MMVTIMFLLAATLLVVCLIQFAALLEYKTMADDEHAYAMELQAELASRTKHLHERLEAKSTAESILLVELDEVREEAERLTGELAIAKLSLKNAQNQFEEQSQITLQVENERDDYKDMLRAIAHIFAYERDLIQEVLKECDDFEAQSG
jgi:chromosome segregation ATPase